MSKQTRVNHPIYSLLPTEVEGFVSLAELALDMRWSWNHCADEVWRLLDSKLWELTQNPWVVLQTVSRDQLERVLADPAFRSPVQQEMKRVRQRAGASGGYVYSAAVSAARAAGDYTARVVPHCSGVAVPLEAAYLLWQR